MFYAIWSIFHQNIEHIYGCTQRLHAHTHAYMYADKRPCLSVRDVFFHRFKCTVPCTDTEQEGTTVAEQNGDAALSLEAREHRVVGETRRPAIRPGKGDVNRNKNRRGRRKGAKGDRKSKKDNKGV